ncbi:MAG: FtsX-like permease family protein [Chitinophagaceae bacterium]|nr:FtsX-like permease family protein [Chitinophagaceae bacterium]
MLLMYFKIAWRNLLKHKSFSFINIFGLTTGLSCFLLIALYIFDELTYDRFNKNADAMYRIVEDKTSAEGKQSKVAAVAYNISERAKKDFPEVENATRFSMLGRSNVLNNENTSVFYESYFVSDESFFRMFDFHFLQGDRTTALKDPYTVVITDETAKKIFGTENAIGKVIRTDRDSTPYKITGIVNIPANSHLNFNLVFSEATLFASENFKKFMTSDWSSNTFVSYLQLKKNTNASVVSDKINQLVKANREKKAAGTSSLYLQPLTAIHFYSEGIDSSENSGNITHMYVFGIVALFALLIACINYMNLTTARFSGRSKEIAVRKVAGASQRTLMFQFLSESFLVTIIALIFSLALVKLTLPWFNSFTEKKLSLGTDTDYRIWMGIVFITIFTSIISGIYPALFQSRLKPYLLLKNKLAGIKGNISLRKVLVIFQFAVSIIMIISTIIVYQQLQYVNKKDMGFNKEQLLVVDINSGAVRRSAETIKSEFSKIAAVKSVSVTSRVPGEWKVIPKVKVKKDAQAGSGEDMYFMSADEQFLKTFAVQLQSGRNFTNSNSDSGAVMINETAAKILGINKPSEQVISIPSIDFSGNVSSLRQPYVARVIAIVKDFNFQSLRQTIAPMVISYQKNPVHNIDYFTARISSAHTDAILQQMKAVLANIDPSHLFEYNFLDKQWEVFYREDQKRETIFLGVAFITILIACMGLFALATYAAEQRTKEIGIRKVLGASVPVLVTLLSKDFLKLVLIADVIAFPVALWAMKSWLKDFAYRVNISWWVFVLAGAAALIIAFVTVSFQAIKAAMSNPVKSLRTE